MTTRICTGCGKPMKAGAAFCTSCGKDHRIPVAAQAQGRVIPGASDPGILPVDILEPPIPPGELTINLQRRFPAQVIAIFLLFIGGLGAFFYGWISTMRAGGPYALRAANDGFLLSTTTEIHKFDETGKKQWSYSAGTSFIEGMLNFDVDSEGRIFLTNTHRGQMEILSADGKLLKSFDDDLDTEFWLAVLKSGDVAVVDSNQSKLQIYSRQGKKIRETGKRGVKTGEFRFPSGVAQLPDGTILVVDTDNLRIQKFNELLKPAGAWTFTRRIVERTGADTPLVIKKDSDETSNLVHFFPRSIYVDEELKQVYVGFETIYQSARQKGHIAVFDYSGKFMGHRRPKFQDGRLFNSFRMGPAPDGRVALVDPHNVYVGLWDPSGDRVKPLGNPTVNALVAQRSMKRFRGRILYWGGIACAAGSFLLLGVLFIPGQKILDREAAKTAGQDPERIAFVRRRLPPEAAAINPERRYDIPKATPAEIAAWCSLGLGFVILIAGIYVMSSYAISRKLIQSLMLIAPVFLILLIILTHFIKWKASRRGAFLKMNLRIRNGLLFKNMDRIKAKLSDDEKLIDAHAYLSGFVYGLLVLTDRKLIHIAPEVPKPGSFRLTGAKSFGPKISINEETPAPEIDRVTTKRSFNYLPSFVAVSIRILPHGENIFPAGCPMLAGQFAHRVNAIVKSTLS